MTKSLKEFNFLKIKIMKRINKMNELNVVNSKVTAELVKQKLQDMLHQILKQPSLFQR